MHIRPASAADISAAAAIKVESWRQAYRGLVPDAVLDAMTVDTVRAQWLGVAVEDFAASVLVAESGQGIDGYAISGPVRDRAGDFEGQLHALYLRPARVRAGIGTALFRAASDRLARLGFDDFLLWVFEANTPARGFYERQGGALIPGARVVTDIDGALLPEVAYGFRTAALA